MNKQVREIACIGNSHVHYILGQHGTYNEEVTREIDGFRFSGYAAKGATVWGLTNPNSKSGAYHMAAKVLNKKPSEIFVCFGEVDVRMHIHKHPNLHTSVSTVIDRFMQFLISLGSERIHVMGTIPYTEHVVSELKLPKYLRQAPVVWNAMLARELLKDHRYNYIDVYSAISTDDGLLKDGWIIEQPGEWLHLKSELISPIILEQL